MLTVLSSKPPADAGARKNGTLSEMGRGLLKIISSFNAPKTLMLKYGLSVVTRGQSTHGAGQIGRTQPWHRHRQRPPVESQSDMRHASQALQELSQAPGSQPASHCES